MFQTQPVSAFGGLGAPVSFGQSIPNQQQISVASPLSISAALLSIPSGVNPNYSAANIQQIAFLRDIHQASTTEALRKGAFNEVQGRVTSEPSEFIEFLSDSRVNPSEISKGNSFCLGAKLKLLLNWAGDVETRPRALNRNGERCAALWFSRASIQVFSVPGSTHAHPLYCVRTADGDELVVTQASLADTTSQPHQLLERVQLLNKQRKPLPGVNAGGAASGMVMPVIDIDSLSRVDWLSGLNANPAGQLISLQYATLHVRMRTAEAPPSRLTNNVGVELSTPLLIWLNRPRLPVAPLVALVLKQANWRSLSTPPKPWEQIAALPSPSSPAVFQSTPTYSPQQPVPFVFPATNSLSTVSSPAFTFPSTTSAAAPSTISSPSAQLPVFSFATSPAAPSTTSSPSAQLPAFSFPTASAGSSTPAPAFPALGSVAPFPSLTPTSPLQQFTLPSSSSAPAGAFSFPAAAAAPASGTQHKGVTCDQCRTADFTGIRYKCLYCPDYDLCERCVDSKLKVRVPGGHASNHLLIRIADSTAESVTKSVYGQNRSVLVHAVLCSGCGSSQIVGARFKCMTCPDANLCEACEALCVHPRDHPLLKSYLPMQ